MPAPLGPIALATLANAIRVAGGIKKAKTVGKDFAEGMAPPIVPKTQAQINAEGLAKIKQTLKIPEKGTAAYSRYLAKRTKDSAVSSEKAGKASTTISKKTPKK
jgi:hypothetical protein